MASDGSASEVHADDMPVHLSAAVEAAADGEPAPVAAEEDDGMWPPNRIILLAHLGLAGRANFDLVNSDAEELLDLPSLDLDLVIGGSARFDWFEQGSALAVSVGLGAFAWKPEAPEGFDDSEFDIKSRIFAHLALQVRVRASLLDDHLELYAGVPINLGLSILPSEGEADGSIGWGVGLGANAGVFAFFTDNIGINVEGGISYTFLFHDATPSNPDDDLRVRIIVRQVLVSAGLVFQF